MNQPQQIANTAGFLFSDKPPNRSLLRRFPNILRAGEYSTIVLILTTAALISPSQELIYIYIAWIAVFLLYFLVRRVLEKKKNWLMREQAVWIHGLVGVVGVAFLYFTFRMAGYGFDESDPANIWIITLALQRRFILLRHVEYYYDVLRRGRLVGDAGCLWRWCLRWEQ
jgi:hypothetical protein